MDEYLHNRLMSYIAPKNIMEVNYSISYDGENPRVLFPKEESELIDECLKLNFEK